MDYLESVNVPEVPSFEELLERTKFTDDIPGLTDKALELSAKKEQMLSQAYKLARALGASNVSFSALKEVFKLVVRSIKDFAPLYKSYFFKKIGLSKTDADVAQELSEILQKFILGSNASMVKLGQFISTSRGLLPDVLVDSFSWCTDSVEPEDFSWVEFVIRQDLGREAFLLIKEIDKTPIASASIAQTHLAVLKDNTPIILKVQRNNLLKNFSREIKAFALLFKFLDANFDPVKIANLPGFLNLFISLFVQELNFELEALNMLHIGAASKDAGQDFVKTPKPIPSLISQRVLGMQKLEGMPYSRFNWGELTQERRNKILELAVTGTIEHSLAYGIFHGDLHAGNVFANSDGTLALLDYGIVGRFNDLERKSIVKFLLAFGLNDTLSQLKAMQDFNAVPKNADLKELAEYLDKEFSNDKPITQKDLGEELGKVISFLSKQGFILPPSLVLFFKNVLYLNGFASAVAPETDLLSLIEPVLGYFSEKYSEFIGQVLNQ
jgi:ubiquinone biosynthesis protein